MSHQHRAGCGCTNDDEGEKFSLYRYINVHGLRALNACDTSAKIKHIFRAENQKTLINFENIFVQSEDEDPELIIVVPFTGSVRIRKVVVLCAGNDCPTEMQLFKNHDLDFESVGDIKPTEIIRLVEDPKGELEYTVSAPKFSGVHTLSLFFPDSVGHASSRIYYIGLLGEYTPLQDKMKGIVYESKPQMKDHESRADKSVHGRLI